MNFVFFFFSLSFLFFPFLSILFSLLLSSSLSGRRFLLWRELFPLFNRHLLCLFLPSSFPLRSEGKRLLPSIAVMSVFLFSHLLRREGKRLFPSIAVMSIFLFSRLICREGKCLLPSIAARPIVAMPSPLSSDQWDPLQIHTLYDWFGAD